MNIDEFLHHKKRICLLCFFFVHSSCAFYLQKYYCSCNKHWIVYMSNFRCYDIDLDAMTLAYVRNSKIPFLNQAFYFTKAGWEMGNVFGGIPNPRVEDIFKRYNRSNWISHIQPQHLSSSV